MGLITVPGLDAPVRIEGDAPNERETDAILRALDKADPSIKGEINRAIEKGTEITPKGPLGVMPREARGAVRQFVEDLPWYLQLPTEMGPAVTGAGLGATALAPTIPFAGPIGPIAGGLVGAVAAEGIAQETGVAPRSELNMALTKMGPLLGVPTGLALKGLRYTAGQFATRGLPFARTASARLKLQDAAKHFDTLGAKILAKSKLPEAGELFSRMRRAKAFIRPDQLRNTQMVVNTLSKEMQPLRAFPEMREAFRNIRIIQKTLLADPKGISVEDFATARFLLDKEAQKVAGTQSQAENVITKMKDALYDDLDHMMSSPFKSGRAARLVHDTGRRLQLNWAVRDLEQGVSKFIKETTHGRSVDVKGLSEWLKKAVDPKNALYNKGFAKSLKSEIPEIEETINKLLKVVNVAGNPAGPGSLVVRQQAARTGRALGGAILGGIGAGAPGAAIGAVSAASFPEVLVGLLLSKPGSVFLRRAAEMGKGELSKERWVTLMTMVTRAAGTGEDVPEVEAPE